MRIVVKVGSSSVTKSDGSFDESTLGPISESIARLMKAGHSVVLVSSGAISCGLGRLGVSERPTGRVQLRAAASLGQVVLSSAYEALFRVRQIQTAQLLMIPSDFADRRQYLHARETLSELVGMGVLPIINENDALSNDQLRYGDNDLLAALVCNLFAADLLLLLTDQEGIFSADPRLNAEATLIQEISDLGSVDADVGESGSMWGSGGMASKLKAARMAAHSGVQTVIAGARVRDVVDRVVQGGERLGTLIRPYGERLPARKLWIAFAASPVASVAVDHGARMAVERQGRSLLVAGVLALDGPFSSGEIVTVRDVGGEIFAKGIVRRDSSELAIPVGEPPISDGLEMVEAGRSVRRDGELIHRDDLVVLTR